MLACHADGATNGRWDVKRCAKSMSGTSLEESAAQTSPLPPEEDAREGREPLHSEAVSAGGWRTAWSLIDETRTRWGGKLK